MSLIDELGRTRPLNHVIKPSLSLTETLQTIAELEAEPRHQTLELKFWPSWPSKKIIFIKYFALLNKSAANLINFSKFSNLHMLIPTCTFINFRKIFQPALLLRWLFNSSRIIFLSMITQYLYFCQLIKSNSKYCT